ncbi:MAG TPA: nickel ABC transporter permease [Thermomicrobiaceae bacterium]|nr:nickel ABC transporter permease [Thermomicrobiaceae bacterium]
MQAFLLRRLLQSVVTLVGVSVAVFLMLYFTPGDPVQVMLQGSSASPQQVASLRHQLGLDQPIYVRYGTYLLHALKGDLGTSYQTREAVRTAILEQLPATLQLTFAGLFVAVTIGLLMGIIAAVRRDTWLDTLSMNVSLLGVSIPNFWLGMLLILAFSLHFKLFPAIGSNGIRALVLPAIALGWGYAAIIARLVRHSLIEVMQFDYIKTARAKGLAERIVVARHAIKNALIPVVTIIGLQFGHMLANAVIIESLFARQGIGRLIVSGILSKDFPMVQGVVLFAAVGYVAANLLVDVSYAVLDPRIRFS